jgi:protocatechuate 3,4-dioxygenase beta subunit
LDAGARLTDVQLDRIASVSRRRLLQWAGGLGLAVLVPGCSRDAPSTSGTVARPSATSASADCVLMPELTEGPYYLDLDLVRRDITEGRPGVPLDLRVTVVDVGSSCSPIEGAAVELWHADAGGAYSGVEGDSDTFLRGTQMTGADGTASFRTIYPGWYSGRAVHIHVKVHVGSGEAHTGQLFFDEDVTAAVYANEPYSERPGPDVTNEADGIFAQSAGTMLLSPKRADDRYAAAVTLGIQRV